MLVMTVTICFYFWDSYKDEKTVVSTTWMNLLITLLSAFEETKRHSKKTPRIKIPFKTLVVD